MNNSFLKLRSIILLIIFFGIISSCDFLKKESQEDEIPVATDFELDEDIQNLNELDSILIDEDIQGFVSSDYFLDSFYEENLKSIETSNGFQNYSISVELDSLRETDFFNDNKFANQNKIASNPSEELKVLARVKAQLELTESQRKLFNLHEKLFANAIFMTDREQHTKNDQNGLAYVWGSKEYIRPFKPYKYKKKSNICQENMYGLDCSGMVYQLMLQSGVNFGVKPRNFANASFFSKSSNWIKPSHKQSEISPLPNYFDCTDCFEVINIENPEPDEIVSGDIIYFRNSNKSVYHIGICLKFSGTADENSLVIFESRGSPSKNCSYNKNRGPQTSRVISKRLKNYKDYGVIRIIAN